MEDAVFKWGTLYAHSLWGIGGTYLAGIATECWAVAILWGSNGRGRKGWMLAALSAALWIGGFVLTVRDEQQEQQQRQHIPHKVSP